MFPIEYHELVGKIHASGCQLVVAVTGGGSGAISALLQTPGASRTVLEAVVPYSLAALVEWIGGKPDQACSEATARAMAMAAFMRARALAHDADPHRLVGVGLTGSLATDRVKRGERRIHLAAQTAARTQVFSLSLADETTAQIQGENPLEARMSDEINSTAMLLRLIGLSVGAQVAPLPAEAGERWRGRLEVAPQEWTELLLGERSLAIVKPGTVVDHFGEGDASRPTIVFPGAFNPPHTGHLKMATEADRRLGGLLTWELSITNVDKPPLDFIAMRSRAEALRELDSARPIALSRAATFRDKAALFPGVTFVVGVDTMERIVEPRYYDGDAARRDEAIAEIERRGCRFLVFGRGMGERFVTLGDLNLPTELRKLCDEAPESDFREDVSSTQLRKSEP